VRQRNFTRFGDCASAYKTHIRNCMVRCPERSFRYEGIFFCNQAHHTVDFCRFQSFFETHAGKNCRNAAGQHGFAGTRRADHYYVVATCRRHFQSAFDMFLAFYICEIQSGIICTDRLFKITGDGGFKWKITVQKLYGLIQTFYPYYVNAFNHCRFGRIFSGKYNAFLLQVAAGSRQRQRTSYRAQFAVQRQLSQHHIISELLIRDAVCASQNAQRYRKVEGGTLFADICRSKIDCYPA